MKTKNLQARALGLDCVSSKGSFERSGREQGFPLLPNSSTLFNPTSALGVADGSKLQMGKLRLAGSRGRGGSEP